MADVIPFKCWRPSPNCAAEVAAAPYDTFSRAEASAEVSAHPLSFLRIDKPIALFSPETDEYAPEVYAQAGAELDECYAQGIMAPHNDPLTPAYFVYRLTREDHRQTGIVACASVADYQSGVIKRHENTRTMKEQDRIDHILALEAHTGPVLLTYPSEQELDSLLAEVASSEEPLYDFVAPDGVRHEFWSVDGAADIELIRTLLAAVPTLYIADGHHRAAAAAKVAEMYSAADFPEAQYFLVALFGSGELEVLDYNRTVSDLAGLSTQELLASIEEVVDVEQRGPEPYRPTRRGEFGMYVQGSWYRLSAREQERPDDVVDGLDVALLHDTILAPILKVTDPRSDPRICYVGGIRGLTELAERVDTSGGVAFALYPCSLQELFAVADEGRLMPPKSTWFEPKPRSGLAIHRIKD